MAHFISGIIAPIAILRGFSSERGLHAPAALCGDLGFLALSDKHLDGLFPQQGEFDPAMTYLSAALKEELGLLSLLSPVAYIETEYFGGAGEQGATVYRAGLCIVEPWIAETGAVSEALALLGVEKGSSDEFDSAGLSRFRNNDDWIKAAVEAEHVGMRGEPDSIPANEPEKRSWLDRLICFGKSLRRRSSRDWRVRHSSRDSMHYEEKHEGKWRCIVIEGEMQMEGLPFHVVRFATSEQWLNYPEWARHRRREIIDRIKSDCPEPAYEYWGDD